MPRISIKVNKAITSENKQKLENYIRQSCAEYYITPESLKIQKSIFSERLTVRLVTKGAVAEGFINNLKNELGTLTPDKLKRPDIYSVVTKTVPITDLYSISTKEQNPNLLTNRNRNRSNNLNLQPVTWIKGITGATIDESHDSHYENVPLKVSNNPVYQNVVTQGLKVPKENISPNPNGRLYPNVIVGNESKNRQTPVTIETKLDAKQYTTPEQKKYLLMKLEDEYPHLVLEIKKSDKNPDRIMVVCSNIYDKSNKSIGELKTTLNTIEHAQKDTSHTNVISGNQTKNKQNPVTIETTLDAKQYSTPEQKRNLLIKLEDKYPSLSLDIKESDKNPDRIMVVCSGIYDENDGLVGQLKNTLNTIQNTQKKKDSSALQGTDHSKVKEELPQRNTQQLYELLPEQTSTKQEMKKIQEPTFTQKQNVTLSHNTLKESNVTQSLLEEQSTLKPGDWRKHSPEKKTQEKPSSFLKPVDPRTLSLSETMHRNTGQNGAQVSGIC